MSGEACSGSSQSLNDDFLIRLQESMLELARRIRNEMIYYTKAVKPQCLYCLMLLFLRGHIRMSSCPVPKYKWSISPTMYTVLSLSGV